MIPLPVICQRSEPRLVARMLIYGDELQTVCVIVLNATSCAVELLVQDDLVTSVVRVVKIFFEAQQARRTLSTSFRVLCVKSGCR